MEFSKDRLLYNILRQVKENGPQHEAFSKLSHEEQERFKSDAERFVSNLHESELPVARIFVTSRQFHPVRALRKNAMLLRNRYQFFLENDFKDSERLVIKVVLCETGQRERLAEFLNECLGSSITPRSGAITKLLGAVDAKSSLIFHKVRKGTFDEKFAGRTTRFWLDDNLQAIYDNGEIYITQEQWKEYVPFPKGDRRPWGSYFVLDEEGYRAEAFFRYSLYGELWKKVAETAETQRMWY